jgi:hypothetical protein
VARGGLLRCQDMPKFSKIRNAGGEGSFIAALTDVPSQPTLTIRVNTLCPSYLRYEITHQIESSSAHPMAASIPPSLKAADISRFAQRAAQLEIVKPIIAYYCTSSVLYCCSLGDFLGKYQVVNQILAKGLHNADQESIVYTTRLMDDLEQVRGSALQKLRP